MAPRSIAGKSFEPEYSAVPSRYMSCDGTYAIA